MNLHIPDIRVGEPNDLRRIGGLPVVRRTTATLLMATTVATMHSGAEAMAAGTVAVSRCRRKGKFPSSWSTTPAGCPCSSSRARN